MITEPLSREGWLFLLLFCQLLRELLAPSDKDLIGRIFLGRSVGAEYELVVLALEVVDDNAARAVRVVV